MFISKIKAFNTLLLIYIITVDWEGRFHVTGLSEPESNTDRRLEPWYSIPDITSELCKSSTICPKYYRRGRNRGPNPCCTDCSCDPHWCRVKSNCCFPELHDYHERRQHQTCTYPVATTLGHEDMMYFTAYYMVTKNPVGGCRYSAEYIAQTEIDPGEYCGDITIAPWGSLLPVYSRTSATTIYKNRHCAVCFGVKDAELWNATIFCKTENNTIESTVDFPSLDLSVCSPRFLYDRHKEIKSEECIIDLYSDCPKTFPLNLAFNLTHESVRYACKKGLYSPFKKLYRNVFCYMCHNRVTMETINTPCTATQKAVGDDIGNYRGPKMLGLLDHNFLQMIENSHSQKVNPGEQMACRDEGAAIEVSRCRPLFCPTGQLRYPDGTCRYVNPIWSDKGYAINIKMIPKKGLALKQIQEPVHRYLKSPWPDVWNIGMIFVRESHSSMLDYIAVVLSQKFMNQTGTEPAIFIQKTIKENLAKEWELRLHNDTVILKPEFIEFTLHETHSKERNEKPVSEINPSLAASVMNLTAPYLTIKYRSSHYDPEDSLITKMFYCDQIELHESEFEVFTVESYHILKHGDTILKNAEFTSFLDSHGDPVARICVEDSDLTVVGTNLINISGSAFVMDIKPVLLLILVCIYFINVY